MRYGVAPSRRPLMNKKAERRIHGAQSGMSLKWLLFEKWGMKGKRVRCKKEHKPSENLRRGKKLIKDEIFFKEINFPCIWVYVHTFCICVSATLKVWEREMMCGSLEASITSFLHKSSTVTGSTTPPLPALLLSLLSSLETCHHQLQSRKSCDKVCPIVIQFATEWWAADNCKRHAILFGDVIHIPQWVWATGRHA